jgi:hypothetical protein
LPLIFFGFLGIQSVIDSHCNLSRDLQHKIHLGFHVNRRTETKHQRPQTMLRGGQWQPARGDNVVAQQELHYFGPALFLADVGNNERLLLKKHPSGGRLVGRKLQIGYVRS